MKIEEGIYEETQRDGTYPIFVIPSAGTSYGVFGKGRSRAESLAMARAARDGALDATTTSPHVVTPAEEMLRQQRPAGKASDPRQQVETTPREAIAGFGYLLADEHDRVKLGAATDVLQRRADLQVGNADDLTILGVIETDDMFALEAALKAHYRHARVRGEWFRRDAVEPFFGTEGLS